MRNGNDRHVISAELSYHLSICEFCLAEVEFYRQHPPVEEEVTPEEMPKPLFDLAEALLHGKSDSTPLYKLIDDRN